MRGNCAGGMAEVRQRVILHLRLDPRSGPYPHARPLTSDLTIPVTNSNLRRLFAVLHRPQGGKPSCRTRPLWRRALGPPLSCPSFSPGVAPTSADPDPKAPWAAPVLGGCKMDLRSKARGQRPPVCFQQTLDVRSLPTAFPLGSGLRAPTKPFYPDHGA